MRMMVKIQMQVEMSNKAIKEDLLPKLVQHTTEILKPEATYFTAEEGDRTAIFIFDMKDASQLPAVCEPWFQWTNAKIDVKPVMNVEELKIGLQNMPEKF